MILKSLYDYAQVNKDNLPSEGMEMKEIEFIIVLNPEGRFVRFESTRDAENKCAAFLVPKSVTRSANVKANILWDNGKYTLGIGEDPTVHKEKFVEIVNEIAKAHPDNKGIQALSKFYKQDFSQQLKEFEKDPLYPFVLEGLKSNFSFRLQSNSRLIAEDTSLYSDMIGVDENSPKGRCLVTGKYGDIIRLMTATRIFGSSPSASLISFQRHAGYDSYGKSQAYNAPISPSAEAAIVSVLKKFLSKNSHHKAEIGDRTFLFWGSGASEVIREMEGAVGEVIGIPKNVSIEIDENPDHVADFFNAIFSGKIKTSHDDRFCILGLAPNVGRIAVVLWIDDTLKQFAGKLYQHFEDMELEDSRPEDKQYPYTGVYSMISAVTLGGKVSDAQRSLINETVKAILNGTPYPYQLYTGALQRIRAELSDKSVGIRRVAILKAYINRSNRLKQQNKKLPIMLDKTFDNVGYLCGRLVAVLEKIQTDVKSGDSIRTRYMGAASSAPVTVFPTMLALSNQHREKFKPNEEGLRVYYMQLQQEIMDMMPPSGFPAHLDLGDQGRFFVGYYHQRSDLYKKKEQ